MVDFRQVTKKLKKEGWEVVRVTGSHYQFKKVGLSLIHI